jgi:hypothetical protein
MDEAKNDGEKEEGTDYVESKCSYEILGVTTRDEEVEESNCWSGFWFETNQFICLCWAFEN